MKDSNFTINITAGSIVKAVLIIFLFYILYLLRDLALVVLVAIVIASAIEPGTSWLIRRRLPRAFSVLLIYLVVFSLFAAIFYFIVPIVLSETANVLQDFPQYVKTMDLLNPFHRDSVSSFTTLLPGLPQTLSIDQIIQSITSTVAGFSTGFFTTVSTIFGGFVSFILIIVLSFYLAVREDGVADFLRIITPAVHEDYIIGLWRRARMKIGLWMQGQLLMSLIITVLTYLGLSILGINHPLLLAVMAGIFELIPIFGIILATIPAFLLGFIQGGLTLGLLVIGLYLIIQQFEGHLIYPLVVRKIVGIPPILVILALLAGIELAGFLGIILSVPVSVTLMEFLDDFGHRKHPKTEPIKVKLEG